MPTIINSSQATAATQGILADRLKIDMRDEILLLEPSAGPLTVLLKQLPNKEQVYNPTFKVLKDVLIPRLDRINYSTGYDGSSTTLVVDYEEYFIVGDLAVVPRTAEVVRVTALSATDSTITVTRSIGATAAAALVDNDQLVILAHASAEGSSIPTIKSTKTSSDSNVIQVVRKPFSVTDILDATTLYGGDALTYQAKKAGIEHLKDIEHSIWFSEKYSATGGATPVRATGGVEEWITTNETDVGGTVTMLELENFLRTGFRYGEKSKLFVCSREVLSDINLLAMNKLDVTRSEDTFGLNIKNYESPHGKISIVPHDLFSDADTYKERGYLLDLSQLGYRWMKGRIADDTHIVTNIQNNDVAGRTDEYRTYFGVFRGQEKTCSRLIGVKF